MRETSGNHSSQQVGIPTAAPSSSAGRYTGYAFSAGPGRK
ncbi:Uncharacterised protein [Mycobacteroides abscessus subsp. abscessus]|nr:Uncharacterised protein [Mycobacteroides abscessus subsp. abscessus]SIM17115.1 Uncharacterised protein [Mycobacteroides abscessus subsp. abscessus]